MALVNIFVFGPWPSFLWSPVALSSDETQCISHALSSDETQCISHAFILAL